MQHPSLVERITRSLAYMLRHQPEQFDLELDDYGYADLDDVVAALNERLGEPVEPEDVVQAIESGDRPRYEIREGRIRALYGHSIQVKPGEPAKPPALLYVGISQADAERARRYGLRPGRRSFLHLALTPEDALETGRRASRDYVVITVNALDAWEEGINFYDRRSLFLSDPIPTHFLTVGDVQTDGYGGHGEEEAGGDRGGREPRAGLPRREERAEPPPQREGQEHGVERPVHRPVESRDERPVRTDPGGERHGHGSQERHGRVEHRGEHRPSREGTPHDRPPREERRHPGPGREERPVRREPRGPAPSRERAPDLTPNLAQGPARSPEPVRASAEPALERSSPAASEGFGLGVFEQAPREKPPAPRATEIRPRQSPPDEKPRESARAEPDDSGFGAGV
jgi:putative RNA 2'-phosphotransferase